MSAEALQRASSTLLRLIAAGRLADSAAALVDLGGRPILAWRAPSVGFLYHELSAAKAWTCAALRRTASTTGEQLARSPAAAAYLASLAQGQFAPLPGGALLLDGANAVCALGVAGPGGGAHDEEILAEVAEAAGLQIQRAERAPEP